MAEMKKTRSKTSATASGGEGAAKKSKTPAKTSRTVTQTRSRSQQPETTGDTAAGVVSQSTRHEMISMAAYLRAERRGFSGGNPEDDWYAAEAEIEAMLATGATAPSSRRD